MSTSSDQKPIKNEIPAPLVPGRYGVGLFG